MLENKFYQMFILGTGRLDIALKKNIGGVIFFTKDIQSSKQFKALIEDIKSNSKTMPFLSIDQEGGRVERTEHIHERFLSPKYAYEKGTEFLENQTYKMLDELKEFGINMNFAPCLDVNSNPDNPIIGERAFSNNPDEVCNGFDIVNKVYKTENIIPVVKHFPGHGDANKDSHLELPLIALSINEMESIHIKPFKHAISSNIEALMIAHLHCTCFDNKVLPTSLSKNCINYLKNELGYKGLIVSDDMFMQGVKSFGDVDACLKGIDAGLDMFIYRDSSLETLKILEDVYKIVKTDKSLQKRINESYNKIINIKKRHKLIN